MLALLVVAVLAAAAAGVILLARSHSAAPPQSLVVTVSDSPVGRAIPAGFLGLSMEYKGLAAYEGTNPSAINPVFVQLLRNLSQGQRPELRIGGDSSDWAWVPIPGVTPPGGVKYAITNNWFAVTRALVRELRAKLILGLNLEADSPQIAAAEANAMIAQLGSGAIEALELGNEPELYGSFSWYKNALGQHVKGRPHGYNFADFLHDFSTLAAALPHVPLAGPSSGSPTYMSSLGQFLAAEPSVGVATIHRYPLKHCRKVAHVTIGQLLSDASSEGLADGVEPYLAAAHAHHVPLRIDEINGVSCGGEHGVSDTFASALWALNSLFAMARVGVDGVNFHTVPASINELISADDANGHWHAFVHPQYYGMMMFAQAAPAGAQLLSVSGGGGGLSAWATRARDGRVRVVLINANTGRAADVSVRIPAAHGPATLERLQAPAASALSGVTLGGQSFGLDTTTGVLAGARQDPAITPSSGGGYLVRLPAASAAMLTLQ